MGHHADRRGGVAVGAAPRGRGGRDRQRPDGAVPPDGDADRRRSPTGRDHRLPGRVHRRGRVQGRAGLARRGSRHRRAVRHRAGSPRGLGDGILGRERTRAGAGMTGHFYGVGLGPGDPELVTLKAARLIAAADVVAYHAGVGKESNARRIAAALFPSGVLEEELRYPVTTGATDHPGGYAGAMAEFYEESASRLAVHLEAGRTVVLLAEGDPLFYGSFMYMHDRLAPRFPTEVVPGVPAFTAATAAVASPLVRQTDVLTVLPGTLPEPELARRLADTDGAIIMKLGRTFPAVRRALEQAGRLEHAMYVERASMPSERWMPVTEVDPATVPYFSLIVVPGDTRHDEPGGRRTAVSSITVEKDVAELLVVG